MKHSFTFKDNKSDKFWQIETSGKTYTVTYGKTGNTGTSQTKTFESEEKCLKEAEKLLNEKLKKGYIEKKSTKNLKTKSIEQSSYMKDWHAIMEAKDLHKALETHFNYLADTPDFMPVLKSIMKMAEKVYVNKETLTIQFKGKVTLEATAPALDIVKRYPATFKKVLEKHQKLSLKGDLILGEHGFFEPEWLEEVESELLDITDPEKIISPLWDGSDCWVYHPKEKNTFGEPVLYFLSHEGGDIDRPQPINVGSFFLSQIAERLNLDIELPFILEKIVTNKVTVTEDWQKKIEILYDGVDSYGKNEAEPIPKANKLIELLPKIQSLRFENLSTTEAIPFEKMVALEELDIFCPVYGKKIPLMSLDGIEKATRLKELLLFGHKLTDISKLSPLSKLIRLDLASNKLKDISIIKNFLMLEELNIDNNPISDITPIVGLPKLKNLSINSTNVKDITSLIQLKSLKYLLLPKLDKEKIDAFRKSRPDVEIL